MEPLPPELIFERAGSRDICTPSSNAIDSEGAMPAAVPGAYSNIDLIPIRRALLSVSDKTGIEDFARRLIAAGAQVISTGGTAAALKADGLPVTDIESVTGFPEIMHGRVKTLHPNIHGALLAIRDEESHTEAMAEHGIEGIDLIAVNLYPFEAVTDASEDPAIEMFGKGEVAQERDLCCLRHQSG